MDTTGPNGTPLRRSDDLAFIKLVIEVENLRTEVEYLKRLVYLPQDAEGTETLTAQTAQMRLQLRAILARQAWLQATGGAILVGIIVQVVQFFLRK